MFYKPPPPKIVPFLRQCRKSGRTRQATDDSIIRLMRFACWVTKATDIFSEYVIYFCSGNNGYANAPPMYVMRTLPVLLCFILYEG